MKPKRTTAKPPARKPDAATPVRVVIVTLDNHSSGVLARAEAALLEQLPGLCLSIHAASNWESDPDTLAACHRDIESGDIILVTMLFMENHIKAVLPALEARRDRCDAMICAMCAAEVMRLTRMGRFQMDGEPGGLMALLKRLRGKSQGSKQSTGAQQLSVLRQLPRILRFIPGTAQDVRAYFLTLQYWLAGSEVNLQRLVLFLVDRYATGPRAKLGGKGGVAAPQDYPEVGLYHPRMKGRISDRVSDLPAKRKGHQGTVGVLIMRSYVLAGNTAHYDAVIEALEARHLRVIPAFSSGLDSRPAAQRYFLDRKGPRIDALLSLTGFSLVGGPAYNDTEAADALLRKLDIPYVAAQGLEFQSLQQWDHSPHGLLPLEATMMVAIPELDGATGPMIFGGRMDSGADGDGAPDARTVHDMHPHMERIDVLADRLERLVALRTRARDERKLAIVLFNFPPNVGNAGTAAHLSVFASLFNTLRALRDQGYRVDLPENVDALRACIDEGNASQYGTPANVVDRISTDDYVAETPWLEEIEAQWGAAPGKELTDGRSLMIMGAQFGNVLVTLQPGMGYEGDPMRLLFEGSFTPTHAFSACYHYLRRRFSADAVLHFGTHGALEFMPGKQVGLSGRCWPDRLIGDLPNFYLYAANNPSEGLIAKRRSAATLISYLTPPVAQCELYAGLLGLRETIDHWRSEPRQLTDQDAELAALIQEQAVELDLLEAGPIWPIAEAEPHIVGLHAKLQELEETLIPYGLHVVGEAASREQRIDMLASVAIAEGRPELSRERVTALVDGASRETLLRDCGGTDSEETLDKLVTMDAQLQRESELPALVHALDGGFTPAVTGGDLLRTPDILPTGRNLHGFDPYRIPGRFALMDGRRQADELLARHCQEGNPLPESIALELWGTDNLKTEGGPIAQALALMGAAPRLDSYGRVCGATLLPLESLPHPRIDVIMTLSGIFRDLLPLQTRLLAEAAWLAASADEPEEQNFVRKHTLAYQREHDCDLETAALRVFSNSEGAYGSNVNLMIDNSRWEDEEELANAYTSRKCFAYNRNGASAAHADLLRNMLGGVELAYQNLDSVELGVTTVDHYFDTLGGITRAVRGAAGRDPAVYITDQTAGKHQVRSLQEQVSLETRSRVLNPMWYENMLQHGYEGVRHIEEHVTNTVGWSATTGQVAPWVYQRLSETFILDEAMRKRMAKLNPGAAVKVAQRLLEAQERQYWDPDEECLKALRQAGEDLEDWLEGISEEAAA
ncbi:MAG: magnesium chelatase subunit H [Pseudomonadota bacterium]